MNNLERRIFQSALKARDRYQDMTGGWWLWHGPESYLQSRIAESIYRGGDYVYLEASPKKIRQDKDKPSRGRPPNNLRQRFDLVVWWKGSNRERALIETKRAISSAPVFRDIIKMQRYLSHAAADARCGYVVLYSEATGVKSHITIANLFDQIGKASGVKRVAKRILPKLDEGWRWGLALFRVEPS